ncbi:MAG: hypothetical protein AB8H86_08785 [Polyangiales bacterium]
MRWLRTLLVLLVSCAGEPPPGRVDGGADAHDEDTTLADAGADVVFTDTGAPTDVPQPLPCDDGFEIEGTALSGAPLVVRFTHPTSGLTNINLRTSGAGAPVARFDELESDEPPFQWRFIVDGHAPTRLTLELVADPEERVYGTCTVRVNGGSDGGTQDGGTPDADTDVSCVPNCSDSLCGEDDGCGRPCAGGHRDAHGGVSDCRLAGNCGCGVEPNDNMECTGEGMCRIRCSCDCLPPQVRSAEAVAGLNHGASCTLVFRESGDPTVWDSANERALCPTDYDPGSDAHCNECPPCHRSRDQCGLERWCECTDPSYRARDPQYDAMCGG